MYGVNTAEEPEQEGNEEGESQEEVEGADQQTGQEVMVAIYTVPVGALKVLFGTHLEKHWSIVKCSLQWASLR